MGIHHASLYADIAKFFDSLDLVWLIDRAIDLGFSQTVLALEAEAFLAPRYLKRGEWVGPPIYASQSIVAGSTNGTTFGKIFLYPILQAAQAQAETTTIWSYIDDTVWRSEGTKCVVTSSLSTASAALAQQCRASRLTVSPKTTLVASSTGLRKDIARRMRQHGVPGHGAHHMVDLGVDVVTGNRRSQRKAHARHKRAALRARRVQGLRRAAARLGKLGASLHATGVQPQAVFGHEVWGVAPSKITQLRRSAAAAAAGTGPGRCLDTAMATLYDSKDPAIKLRTQLVHEWLTQWLARPELHKRVQRIWPHVHHRLLRAKSGKWRKVHGPVAAVIATLLDAGWRPTSPTSWKRPTAAGVEEWTIPLADQMGELQVDFHEFSELLDDLAVDLDHLRWQRASQHVHGSGLGEAGDVSQIKKELDHCAKQGHWQEWSLNYLVAVWAQWPRQRQIAAGYQGSPLCQRCFGEEETLEHRIWRCPCNQGKPAYDQTAHLVPQALNGMEECPALWLRGINPIAHTTPPPPMAHEELYVHVGAPWPTGSDRPVTIFGDASGGKHGTDPRRRRVGIGLAVIEACGPRWQLAAGAIATLPGRRQTVPRGEIFAFVLALEHYADHIDYVTDNLPLLNGWHAQRWLHLSKGANSDLWARIGRSLQTHPHRRVTVTWTPSHQEDEGEPLVSHFLASGNCCADRLANLGAEAAAATANASTPHADRWDVIASQIRRRARQALLDAAGGDPWLTERPAAEQVARPSPIQCAIDSSEHQIVTLGQGKWKCLLCRQVFTSATLLETARTPCVASSADWATFDHVRAVPHGATVCMGTGTAHESHRLYEWPAHSLFFCGTCGAYGTTMGMGLRAECKGAATRKTTEALKRISQGVYPSHQGPPEAITQANRISATIAHVVSGAMAPAEPPQAQEEAPDNSTAGQVTAVIGLLHGQAIQAAQRPSRRQAREPGGPQAAPRRRRRAASAPGGAEANGTAPGAAAPAEACRAPGGGPPRHRRPAPAPPHRQDNQASGPSAAAEAPHGPRLWLPDYTSPFSGNVILFNETASTHGPGPGSPPTLADDARDASPAPCQGEPAPAAASAAQPPEDQRTFAQKIAYLLGAARRSASAAPRAREAGHGPGSDEAAAAPGGPCRPLQAAAGGEVRADAPSAPPVPPRAGAANLAV